MYQETPQSLGPNKVNKRQGTIEDDPIYKEFLSKLNLSESDTASNEKSSTEKVITKTPWEETLEELEKREAVSNQVGADFIYTLAHFFNKCFFICIVELRDCTYSLSKFTP